MAKMGPAGWTLILCALVILGFLQVSYPFYFTQDDNLAQFLPGHLLAGRTLFEYGALATFNPHQWAGAPLIQTGVYAVTYPVLYLAYGSARFILGNEFLTLEVFAFFHIIGGLMATYTLGRSLGLSDLIAAFFSSCFVLSGFTFVAGRSWYYILPLLVYLPLIFGSIFAMLGRAPGFFQPNYAFVIFGVCLALLFHSGNAQLWVYACMYVGLFLLLSWRSLTKRSALQIFIGAFLAVALISPLLIIQLDYLRSIERGVGQANGVLDAWMGFFLPYPITISSHNPRWGSNSFEAFGALYFAGGVPLLMFGVGFVLRVMLRGAYIRGTGLMTPVFACGILSLLLVIGDATPVWGFIHSLGPLKTFNHALKVIPFLNFFVGLGAALFMRDLFPNKRGLIAGLVGLTAVLLSINAVSARTSFYDYGFEPYPALPEALRQNVATRHVFSRYPVRSTEANYYAALPHNLATAYGMTSIGGFFDPMVNTSREYRHLMGNLESQPLATLSRFGAEIIFVARASRSPTINPTTRIYESWWSLETSKFDEEVQKLPIVYHGDGATAYRNELADPFISINRRAAHVETHISGSSIKIIFSEVQEGTLTLGLLMQPTLKILVDGNEVTPWRDSWGRLNITLPQGARVITVKSKLPLSIIWWTSLLMFLLLAVLMKGFKNELFTSASC
jgi:hypothetical protein